MSIPQGHRRGKETISETYEQPSISRIILSHSRSCTVGKIVHKEIYNAIQGAVRLKAFLHHRVDQGRAFTTSKEGTEFFKREAGKGQAPSREKSWSLKNR